MTDTSRPTVEALIARANGEVLHWELREFLDSTAEVLGALLTERDMYRSNLGRVQKHLSYTIQRITAVAAVVDPSQWGMHSLVPRDPSKDIVKAEEIRAILRGAPGGTEPTGSLGFGVPDGVKPGDWFTWNGQSGTVEELREASKPWTDPKPWVRKDGSRHAVGVRGDHLPRTKEQYDAEEGNR